MASPVAIEPDKALTAAPNVFPGLLGVAAKVHLAGVRLGQIVRVQTRCADGRRQVVAMHASEQVAVDHVIGIAVDHGLLVFLGSTGFEGGNEGRADVGKVRPHGLGRQHRTA